MRCCGRPQSAEKIPPPLNSVYVDSTRSAAPPIIVGTSVLERLHHDLARAAGRDLLAWRRTRAATIGPIVAGPTPRPTPRARRGTSATTPRTAAATPSSSSWPRAIPLICSYTPSGTTKCSSGSQPRPPSSRAPRPRRAGSRVRLRGVDRVRRRDSAMCERTMIMDGRSVTSCAAAIAARSASRSLTSATFWTCQPCASKRACLSSRVKERDVVPSIVMWLSS